MTQAPLSLRSRNPDVLTCIANLSNDEVFTPPEFANRMLDTLETVWAEANGGASIWASPDVKFLDPFTKSGVFLREITSRLTGGLAAAIPDLRDRVDHILTNQVFGIGITQLTAMLSRRSLYCSKWANGKHSIARSFKTEVGNVWFERTEHTWASRKKERQVDPSRGGEVTVEIPGTGRCNYCGANEAEYARGDDLESHAYAFIHTDDAEALVADLFGADMHFDVIIGNPPYQLGRSGGEAVGSFAMPIYHKFIQAAKSLDPRYVVMVTPSRWFAGGRIPDDFRQQMLTDRHLRELVDFPDATSAFPGVDIGGGVSYFLWDRDQVGDCRVRTIAPGISDAPMERRLDTYSTLVRYNVGAGILERIWPDGVKHASLAENVSPIQPFGLRTTVRGFASPKALKAAVSLKSSAGLSFIERSQIPRNHEWIDQWKVVLGRAYGERGSFPYWITGAPEVLPPNSAVTETYLVIGRFGQKVEAERLAAYLRTRFVRFLVSLQKYTQDIYSERFSFVPDLDMDRTWTDAELYERYSLSVDEIAFIESMVRPMDRGAIEAGVAHGDVGD